MTQIVKSIDNVCVILPCGAERATWSAARSLGRAGYQIVTTWHTGKQMPPLALSRYVSEVAKTPDPSKSPVAFRHWLDKRLETQGQEKIVPITEGVVAALMHVPGASRDRFILPRDENLQFTLSKFRATRAAEAAAVRVPRTVYLRPPGFGRIDRDLAALEFPFILKWDNFEDQNGEYCKGSNRIVDNEKDFLAVVAELEPIPCGVIAQELVPGYGVGAFFLRHGGRIRLRFAHRRLHEVPWTGGVSSLCESSDDPEVLAAGERLLEAIDYEGVAMVEFRKEDGKSPAFLEINGRLWGSLGLALRAGADFPRAMVECHLHGSTTVSQPDLTKRIRWRNLGLELDYLRSVFARPLRTGDLRPSRVGALANFLWHSIDPRTKSDLFWWDDPSAGLLALWRIWRGEGARIKQMIFSLPVRRRERLEMGKWVGESKAALEGLRSQKIQNILFLCYGNICRSPYAEFRWKALLALQPGLPFCTSGGFHKRVERSTPLRFQSAGRHRGVELADHRSKRISSELVDAADLIVLMDRRNWLDLAREFPRAVGKTILLGVCDDPHQPEIPDPYDQPLPAGAIAYERIDKALSALAGFFADGNAGGASQK
jgi:protein-tyrosine-phosphatase/predicted ATP-grasp superfamily ATP-dependent carboligase